MQSLEQTVPAGGVVVTEGSTMTYKCEALAKPPPVIRFSLGSGPVITEGVTHSPPSPSINADTPKGTSTLVWTMNATKALNGEKLNCQIVDHPDKNNRPEISTTIGVYCKSHNMILCKNAFFA